MDLNYLENVISERDLADHPATYLLFDKRRNGGPERWLPYLEGENKERKEKKKYARLVGCAYTEKLFIIYLKLKINQKSCILPGNPKPVIFLSYKCT